MAQCGPKIYYSTDVLNWCVNPPSGQILDALGAMYNSDSSNIINHGEFFGQLMRGTQATDDHFAQIDTVFSQLLPGTLKEHPSLVRTAPGGSVAPSSVFNALRLLSRLPSTPQMLFALPFNVGKARNSGGAIWDGIRDGSWATKYLLPAAAAELNRRTSENAGEISNLITNVQDLAWENFYVTAYVDTNTLIIANMISSRDNAPDFGLAKTLRKYVDTLSELIETYEGWLSLIQSGYGSTHPNIRSFLETVPGELMIHDESHLQGRSILRTFLWTVWQRTIMLFFFYVVGVQIHHGLSAEWVELLAIQGSDRLASVENTDIRPAGTDYMCNWAFELLRASRSSLGLDFRQLFLRFNESFAGRSGRCIHTSTAPCRGDGPESCQRFTDAETKAQSVHRTGCAGDCHRIIWDESSYREGPVPRAVLAVSNTILLKYCQSDSRTLAITHVWAHGQGGRPEDGINACLHERYCNLAARLGCQSYWIDSACIPSQQPLRGEAIGYINQIFTNSKVTLVSDQDVQSINISSASIMSLEAVLATLLVSDWNVRAWTMIEAIRGSRSIHLLCHDETPVSLATILKEVHAKGAVGLASLLASAQHLLPRAIPGSLVRVEEAGYLLSQRHASRDWDEVIIWSLLVNSSSGKDPVMLWQSQKSVPTAFLLSSSPRIEHVVGFSWAPSKPYVRPEPRAVPLPGDNSSSSGGVMEFFSVRYPPYDGQGSLAAQIVYDPDHPEYAGLSGHWYTLEMTSEVLNGYHTANLDAFEPAWPLANFQGLGDFYYDLFSLNPHLNPETLVYGRPDEMLAYQLIERLLLRDGRAVRLLIPLAEDGISEYEGSRGRGEQFGRLIAICSSKDERRTWRWEGVYQWPFIEEEEWAVQDLFLQ